MIWSWIKFLKFLRDIFFLFSLSDWSYVSVLYYYLFATFFSILFDLFIILNRSYTIFFWWPFTWIHYFFHLKILSELFLTFWLSFSILWKLFLWLWFGVFIWSLYYNVYLLSSFYNLSKETWNLTDVIWSSSSKRETSN